jgi:negative regulator of flagellin synthesis FlgM
MNVSNGITSARLPNDVSQVNGTAAAGKSAQGETGSVVSGAQGAGQARQVQDQASISSTGGLLSAAQSAPDVRAEKIAPIQAAINAGTYSVSSSDVADKLISSLLE